jgi:uncharacterized protein (TIGR02301 family)
VLTRAVCVVGMTLAVAQPLAAAEKIPAKPTATTPAPAASTPSDVKPYDPKLLRLAEILGALTYLRGLCGEKDADAWHKRMQVLLDAEGTTAGRKERLAGAYNRGIEGYELSYRTCTTNAQTIVERFLAEGSAIAKEVENRFGATSR